VAGEGRPKVESGTLCQLLVLFSKIEFDFWKCRSVIAFTIIRDMTNVAKDLQLTTTSSMFQA
jgi:hypothetical protein